MNKNIIDSNDFLDFLTTDNTIEIRDKEEFESFLLAFKKIISLEKEARTYNYWRNLVTKNSKGKYDLLFKYDVNKGLTFYTDRDISIQRYCKEPIHLNKIDNRKACKFCCYEEYPYILTGMQGLKEEFKVCPNCIIEYLEEIIELKPLPHKCVCCNSQEAYKVTTNFRSYYLCKEHLIDFVCYCLDKQAFKLLYQKNSEGRCDFYLHDDFYDFDGTPLQPNIEYADELKKLIGKDFE